MCSYTNIVHCYDYEKPKMFTENIASKKLERYYYFSPKRKADSSGKPGHRLLKCEFDWHLLSTFGGWFLLATETEKCVHKNTFQGLSLHLWQYQPLRASCHMCVCAVEFKYV